MEHSPLIKGLSPPATVCPQIRSVFPFCSVSWVQIQFSHSDPTSFKLSCEAWFINIHKSIIALMVQWLSASITVMKVGHFNITPQVFMDQTSVIPLLMFGRNYFFFNKASGPEPLMITLTNAGTWGIHSFMV